MNIPSLESLVDIVKEAAGLMVTDGFDISQKDGFANIVTSSTSQYRVSCVTGWPHCSLKADSSVRKKT